MNNVCIPIVQSNVILQSMQQCFVNLTTAAAATVSQSHGHLCSQTKRLTNMGQRVTKGKPSVHCKDQTPQSSLSILQHSQYK